MQKEEKLNRACAEIALRNFEHDPGVALNSLELMEQRILRRREEAYFFDVCENNNSLASYVLAWEVRNPWHGIPHRQVVIETNQMNANVESFPPLNLRGFVVRPLMREDIESVLQIAGLSLKEEFGWFWKYPEHFAVLESRLKDKASADDGLSFVFVFDGVVVGYFDSEINEHEEIWRSAASLDIFFHPSIQGKGLAAVAYRLLLEKLHSRKVSVFRGGTAQRPVIHLGHRMGRWLNTVEFRKGASFKAEHFLPYVDLAMHEGMRS